MKRGIGITLNVAIALVSVFSGAMRGMNEANQASYPKYDVTMEMNVMIPMRDGIKLATDIFRPKAKGKFPVILVRTPYGSESARFSDEGKYYARRGYVYAVQDCRGKYDSEGDWYGRRSEAEDGYDSITWLATQNWSTGKVGMIGASYLGDVQWRVAHTQNQYLKALIPIVAPVTLGRESVECDGSSQSPMGLSWLTATDGRVNQNTEAYDWEEIFQHLPLIELPKLLGRNIPFWEKSLKLRRGFWEEYFQSAAEVKWKANISQYEDYRANYEKVETPIFQVSGWFDSASECCFYNYQQIKRFSKSPIAQKNQKVLMGPWNHYYNRSSRIGELDFGPNSVIDLNRLFLRWFDRWLKEIPNGVENEAPLNLFIMGKNDWREAKEWPLPETEYTHYYFHSSGNANTLNGDGLLSLEPPEYEPPDRYIYDSSHPTPGITSGENKALAASGPIDVRPIEERADVLVFTTGTLEEDIEVTGSASVVLYVSSSAPETDFIVRLLDVHPNGCSYPVYVTWGGVINTRCLQPGGIGQNNKKILKSELILPPTSQVFLKGHRIRIDVCSAQFPISRNLNTGEDFATGTKFNVAHQTVYHDEKHPSHIILPVIAENK